MIETLWPMKKKKGGDDILTNMLLSVDMAQLHARNHGARVFFTFIRDYFKTLQAF